MTTPSITLLGVGEAFGETVEDLLGVGVFAFEGGEVFFFVGVGDGFAVFEAAEALLIIPGNREDRTIKKTLREICPIIEMVSNPYVATLRNLGGDDGFGILR